MTKLAVWRMDGASTDDDSDGSAPRRVSRSQVGLEQNLEEWIVQDVTLIGEGLTLVGRQVTIDDGRLDLLAIDARDRWVVIEVKPDALATGALTQALCYAGSLARLDADALRDKLEPGLGQFGDAKTLSERVTQQLADEEEEREIALLLVGAGTHPGLERTTDFLGRFAVPVSIVSFEVFELEGGPKLLIREVVDEPVKPSAPKRRYTVEAIRSDAVEVGVEEQFNRFVDMSRKAELAVQPQGASVRIAPPANRTRFLMYAAPQTRAIGGGLVISVGPSAFAEFFPHIDEEEAAAAIGREDQDEFVAGEALDTRLDQIQRFLEEHFPPPSE